METNAKKARIGARLWSVLLVFGLVGQLAWTLENMYFNVFVYNVFSASPSAIATMVAASAATATLTTLLMGALSDRAGKRKIFICGGYLLWGLSVCAFAFLTPETLASVFPAVSVAAAGATAVIVLDCVMTFFGSTANDAALNAYITDSVPNQLRGRTEGVLAVLPLLSMLIVFGGFDSMTAAGRWKEFFLIFGLLTVAAGILGFFLIKEPAGLKPDRERPYFANIFYGFRPSVIRSNAGLYLALCVVCVFSIAMQIHYPYLIIYMQNYLKLDNYAIVLAIVLVVSSIISVLCGRLMDKLGRVRYIIPAAAILTAGLVGMYFARSFWGVIVAGTVMMTGYLAVTAAGSAMVRDLTPPDKAGMFQGIRMIFFVLIPMVIGPFIGAAVIAGSAETYTDLGVVKQVPTPGIFLAAALFMLVIVLPLWFIIRRERKNGGSK